MRKFFCFVMALLRELDVDRHTIVFFTSDNGPH